MPVPLCPGRRPWSDFPGFSAAGPRRRGRRYADKYPRPSAVARRPLKWPESATASITTASFRERRIRGRRFRIERRAEGNCFNLDEHLTLARTGEIGDSTSGRVRPTRGWGDAETTSAFGPDLRAATASASDNIRELVVVGVEPTSSEASQSAAGTCPRRPEHKRHIRRLLRPDIVSGDTGLVAGHWSMSEQATGRGVGLRARVTEWPKSVSVEQVLALRRKTESRILATLRSPVLARMQCSLQQRSAGMAANPPTVRRCRTRMLGYVRWIPAAADGRARAPRLAAEATSPVERVHA
jgi:hypothetical protein